MSYLVDTNVVSEMRKIRAGRADPNVKRWADQQDVAMLYLSVITIQELETGILLAERNNAGQGRSLRRWLEHQVMTAFAERILPIDLAVARRSAVLQVPKTRPISDSLIAATALVRDLIVVTRNIADFEAMGVGLINPWNADR